MTPLVILPEFIAFDGDDCLLTRGENEEDACKENKDRWEREIIYKNVG